MLHIEKNYYSSSTICKKSQVDIFKITPTGRSQKRIIKKKTPCIICTSYTQTHLRLTGHRYNPEIDVCVVPHEGGLEVVVVAMAMDSFKTWKFCQESWKGI